MGQGDAPGKRKDKSGRGRQRSASPDGRSIPHLDLLMEPRLLLKKTQRLRNSVVCWWQDDRGLGTRTVEDTTLCLKLNDHIPLTSFPPTIRPTTSVLLIVLLPGPPRLIGFIFQFSLRNTSRIHTWFLSPGPYLPYNSNATTTTILWGGSIIIPLSQIRKLRPRKVKELVQSHATWQ